MSIADARPLETLERHQSDGSAAVAILSQTNNPLEVIL